MRSPTKHVLIGWGAIIGAVVLVYLLVALLSPGEPPRARFIGLEPKGWSSDGR